jgi:hypothetical protein
MELTEEPLKRKARIAELYKKLYETRHNHLDELESKLIGKRTSRTKNYRCWTCNKMIKIGTLFIDYKYYDAHQLTYTYPKNPWRHKRYHPQCCKIIGE